jgi:hypothetical protein
MTLTADSKKRVVIPGAAPGDVFVCERKGAELILRRAHRAEPQKKRTKADVLKAIRNWKSVFGQGCQNASHKSRQTRFSAEGAVQISVSLESPESIRGFSPRDRVNAELRTLRKVRFSALREVDCG